MVPSIFFQTYLYRYLKLSQTLEHSVYYFYTSYEMTDRFLWFQLQRNSYSSNWIYILQKPDCHSWWTSKMQSDTLEEWYAIKFSFKVGKKFHRNVWNASDSFWSILHKSSISFEWHKRCEEGRESVRDDENCGKNKEVYTPELIGQTVRVRAAMLKF